MSVLFQSIFIYFRQFRALIQEEGISTRGIIDHLNVIGFHFSIYRYESSTASSSPRLGPRPLECGLNKGTFQNTIIFQTLVNTKLQLANLNT